MVERLLAHDHLVTGESESREEPLECDGMTRLGRGKKGHAWNPTMTARTRLWTVSVLLSSAWLEASNTKTKLGNGLGRTKTCGI
ncbi:hypothetical protein CDL15_Pgr006586 [Punica granatum]|uniref:Uncharacterized protein n=1 Tax=Punica granatum TaxID=22663 RepID=A0A218XYS3_PUNGR|nr:hypothetical protein CDL15_Pgr006586 [Punica granatum]